MNLYEINSVPLFISYLRAIWGKGSFSEREYIYLIVVFLLICVFDNNDLNGLQYARTTACLSKRTEIKATTAWLTMAIYAWVE